MTIVFWIVFSLWVLINIIGICVVVSEGPSGLEIDSNVTLGELFIVVFLIPLPVLLANFSSTKPWKCFKDAFRKIADYQPFKKKSK